METNTHDQQAENNTTPQLAEDMNSINDLSAGNNDAESTDHHGRKKYHSSAMYAASKWHNTINHVKPTHRGIN